MIETTIKLADDEATAALGASLAPHVQPGDVLCLMGPLGAGKTTLARGLIKAATGAREAPSPTFALVETYEAKAQNCGDFTLWHFDLYRLESIEEIWELGFEEALDQGVSVIEWPERIEDQLPPDPLIIALNPAQTPRQAVIRSGENWVKRLKNLNLIKD